MSSGPARRDLVGQRDHLARIAQVDADDPQPVQPVRAESSIAPKRRAASFGKRVVIVVCAPSRSSRSAMYMPIFARPPVSSARRPVRSVRASRRSWLRCRAGRAELVIEGVDLGVALLADVTRTRAQQRAGAGRRSPAGAAGCRGSRRRSARARRWRSRAVTAASLAFTNERRVGPPLLLDRLEQLAGRHPHGHGVRDDRWEAARPRPARAAHRPGGRGRCRSRSDQPRRRFHPQLI